MTVGTKNGVTPGGLLLGPMMQVRDGDPWAHKRLISAPTTCHLSDRLVSSLFTLPDNVANHLDGYQK